MNVGTGVMGGGYVATRVGSPSHLFVRDPQSKNHRVSFCGLRWLRHGKNWQQSTWKPLGRGDVISCQNCIRSLSGKAPS